MEQYCQRGALTIIRVVFAIGIATFVAGSFSEVRA